MESLGAADPRSVGGYPLYARLGAGGMGQVYLARTVAGRPLALKTVRAEFGFDPTFGQRFAREIRNADRVRSPWTAAVVDFSPEGADPQWLATEYVAAPSLSDWVAGYGPLPEAGVVALAAELCEALAAVHAAELAHRDVKPSNVLLPGARPLLIDFGIARAAEDSRHTRTGGMIGSPGYMAPEQATAGTAAEPGDLFALGAVLVYAATGRGPFNRPGEEPSTPALLYRIVHEEPDLGSVPPALTPLLTALLAKDPRDRPTARQASARLRAQFPAGLRWSDHLPAGLADELRAREGEMRATLGGTAKERPQAVGSPAPGIAPAASSPAAPPPVSAPPAAPRPTTAQPAGPVTGTPGGYPPAPTGPVSSSYPPGTAAGTYRHPVYDGQPGGTGAAWGGGTTGAGGAPRRRNGNDRRNVVVAVAVVAVLVVVGVLVAVHRLRDGGPGQAAKGKGGTPTATRQSGGTAKTLPAAWVGTWVGTGPGDPPGTGKFTVTLTLHAGARGDLIGTEVSHVRDLLTGRDIGCTESLRLQQVLGQGVMRFEAATSKPTAARGEGGCVAGHVYTASRDAATDTLRLGAGQQAAGSPSTFTRVD